MSIKEDKMNISNVKADKDDDSRKDPTSFLPDEPMTYELKTKKKKKKKKQEDPFKDIEEKVTLPITTVFESTTESEVDTKQVLDPEVNIKVENIEVELDFNDVIYCIFF